MHPQHLGGLLGRVFLIDANCVNPQLCLFSGMTQLKKCSIQVGPIQNFFVVTLATSYMEIAVELSFPFAVDAFAALAAMVWK